MRLEAFRITRFQFRRDRVIGDSQVRADEVHVAALELVAADGTTGLGFVQSLFSPLPDEDEIGRIFEVEMWPRLAGQEPLALVHRIELPRGGNRRASTLPFGEAVQVALWDLAAKQCGMPLGRMLGARRTKVQAYASGLDFHLDDAEFCAFFGHADSLGFGAFKIKVGHPEIGRDLHRLELLKKTVRRDALVMVDANEAWSAKQAAIAIEAMRAAGHRLLWVEDPVPRDDFEGLRMLRNAVAWTQINAGEYLDTAGKRALLMAQATDILNVHAPVTEVMRIGWLAAELGIPVSLGNTFLEVGVHLATALPEVEWLEYSFQNFDHLVETAVAIVDGWAHMPERPGHGLVLSETARKAAEPRIRPKEALGPAPFNARVRQDLPAEAAQ